MRTLRFILGILLLPLYPFLSGAGRALSEKVRLGEKVVVVTRNGEKKRTVLN